MTTIKKLFIDIETFSDVNLKEEGIYKYAQSPYFEIITFAVSINGDKVKVYDLNSKELPKEIIQALFDDSIIKVAHNATFERICLSEWLKRNYDLYFKDYGGDFLRADCWRCTMMLGRYFSLPSSLKDMGKYLNLDSQKMDEGKDLIKYFCQPCLPTQANNYRTRNLPSHAPDKWNLFLEYNKRDVEVEMKIWNKLSKFPIYDNFWKEYALDQEINDKGILIDSVIADNAIKFTDKFKSELIAKIKSLTGIDNPNSTQQMSAWLEKEGISTDSLDKKSVADLIKKTPEQIQAVLKDYQQLKKTSLKKYGVMKKISGSDNRIRGVFQFYGAVRTGRFTSNSIQLQNLPRNYTENLEALRDLLKIGDYENFKNHCDSVGDTLSELIRTAFIPKLGYKFIVADFSAIEARIIAKLANETWRLKAFADNKDIYCASASQMFHVPVEKNGVNAHLRQKGKIAELALGYGGSTGALTEMGALDMGLKESELQPLVNAWRTANPKIVKFWYDLESKIKLTISYGISTEINSIKINYKKGILFITLPSGRQLCYLRPKIELGKFGQEVITYDDTKNKSRVESYGAKFVENIVQGIARDILINAMINLRDYDIVAHVHDEIILECREDTDVNTICKIMAEPPTWLPDINLKAECFESKFYKK